MFVWVMEGRILQSPDGSFMHGSVRLHLGFL